MIICNCGKHPNDIVKTVYGLDRLPRVWTRNHTIVGDMFNKPGHSPLLYSLLMFSSSCVLLLGDGGQHSTVFCAHLKATHSRFGRHRKHVLCLGGRGRGTLPEGLRQGDSRGNWYNEHIRNSTRIYEVSTHHQQFLHAHRAAQGASK